MSSREFELVHQDLGEGDRKQLEKKGVVILSLCSLPLCQSAWFPLSFRGGGAADHMLSPKQVIQRALTQEAAWMMSFREDLPRSRSAFTNSVGALNRP